MFLWRLATVKGHIYNFAYIVCKVLSQKESFNFRKSTTHSLTGYFPTGNEVHTLSPSYLPLNQTGIEIPSYKYGPEIIIQDSALRYFTFLLFIFTHPQLL